MTKPVPESDTDKIKKPKPLQPAAFVGSMQGAMKIKGDLINPIDVDWEADQVRDQNHPL